jgi:DNA mismatch repair protein MutS2
VIFPPNIEEKIGFDQIRHLLSQMVLSELGQKYVDRIRYSSDRDLVERMLLQSKDFKELLQADQPFPADAYLDLSHLMPKFKLTGAWLTEEEFFNLMRMLRTVEAVFRYFEQRRDKYTELQKLFSGVAYNPKLMHLVSAKIDEEGRMRPNASPQLASISKEMGEKEREVRKRLNHIYKKAQDAGWTADSGITIRNDRLVIPVLAEHKRHLKGFVHDESATGQTYFIEPAEVFDLHNEIRELQLARKREIERILLELTDELRPHMPEVELYQQKLGLVDFIRAKAKLAIELKANMPLLQKEMVIKLYHACHPLLLLHHKKINKSVVPLNVELDVEQRILVISGPNAGGKSVCMKTIALLQYMLQCGLLIPAESHSVCALFQDMLVDIGDDQSIENDLSTYSSHLQHMKYFMEHASRNSLFFIDEFGTGTDPQFGGPIAESVLLQLNQKKAFGVVTTHYSNIKTFANNTPGLLNASMLFDNEQMQPLYLLETGKPGSSHAFEIAQRTGFPKHVLDYAKSRSGHKQLNVDDLLLDLQQDKIEINRLKTELIQKEQDMKKLMSEYEQKNSVLDTQRRQLIQKAKEDALQIVQNANARIEQTIREIKSSKAEPAATKELREQLKQETEQLKKEVVAEVPVIKKPTLHSKQEQKSIELGCTVRIIDSNNVGVVLEMKKDKATVGIGDLRSQIALNRLERISKAEANAAAKVNSSMVKGIDLTEKYQGFTQEINIIGERAEDALRLLRNFIDEAYLLGFKSIRIVHGKGDGILRKLVKDELKRNELVATAAEAHIELGGAGVTIAEIK